MLKKTGVFAFALMLLGILPAPVRAADPFELTIQLFYDTGYYNGIYYSPANNLIKVKKNGPVRPIKVVLKNVTSSTQRLTADLVSKGLNLITFEIADERGNKNIVTKKVDVLQSKAQGYEYLGPGKTKEFEILLNEGEWNNTYKLVKQGATRLRARASYQNGSNIIYSKDYTIQFED